MATHSASAKKPPAKKAAAKPAAATPAKKQPAAAAVISLKAIFEQLGETHGVPKKQVQAMQADLVSAVTTHLQQGARIRMAGLGTLEVRDRPARMGRNPATGEAIEIKASNKQEDAFRPAKELKEAV